MWIKGRRRGGAKDLAAHLQKTDENEAVHIRELEGFSFEGLTGQNLEKAIRQMEAIGYGKGDKRNLFHTIIAPAYGETLTAAQQKAMVEYYAKQMGFKGHQYALIEHWKKGKQHFHLVFNIINPETGKTHELKWTKKKEWQISRDLEALFGHATPTPKGKAAHTPEMQRGKRTGTDPRKMRKEVTAIFHASKTTKEIIATLDKAGYALSRGKRDQLVLVDKYGDTHGLMRRIEGKTLADLRQKFPDIEKMKLPNHADLVKARKPIETNKPKSQPQNQYIDPRQVREDVRKAYRTSKTGAAFSAALNKKGYSLGRGRKGYAAIDSNGNRHDLHTILGDNAAQGLKEKFPDLAVIGSRHASEIIRRTKARNKNSSVSNRSRVRGRAFAPIGKPVSIIGTRNLAPTVAQPLRAMFVKAARTATKTNDQLQKNFMPVRPKTGGWPEAAVIDWEAWGQKNPPRFFAKWPELKS
jgi:hypothetical protein